MDAYYRHSSWQQRHESSTRRRSALNHDTAHHLNENTTTLCARSTLGGSLEERARTFTSVATTWGPSPSGVIARQLALTLDEIVQVRHLHRQLERSLLQAECDVDTELMQPLRPGDRTRLHGRLFTIDNERRRLALAKQEQLRILHQHLLELLNKHAFLTPDDDD